ncbi:amidohydrolase family protein [Halolamina litorea]|nr:amidohydrolase family protein [Halolamina litorea]
MQYVHTDGVYRPKSGHVDGRVVCIEDGEVVDVREEPPADAEPLYEGEGYALPGFVDAHTHGPIRPGEGDQLSQMRADPAVQAVRAANNLETDLRAGTTTVRMMGCEHRLDLRLRESERAGELDAPRILPCGGHLTPTNGHGVALTATDGPEACRQRVRDMLAAGAHHIKYFATGGVSSGSGSLDRAPYTDEEVEAIIDEAHRQGVHVATHAHGGAGARQAIEAGVDTVEHAAAFGPALTNLLAESDAHAVGTFSILHDPEGIVGGDADDPDVMARVEEARASERESWERVLAADVPVAVGTDSMHGNLADEAAHLVDYGASPETAIRAITSEAARASRAERAGTLTPGDHGDVVVVADHPAENVDTLTEPVAVVKNGERVV